MFCGEASNDMRMAGCFARVFKFLASVCFALLASLGINDQSTENGSASDRLALEHWLWWFGGTVR